MVQMTKGIYENARGVRVKIIGSKRELGQTTYYLYFTNQNDRSHFGLTKTGLKQFLKGFKKVQ
jgi:hypothetical protein